MLSKQCILSQRKSNKSQYLNFLEKKFRTNFSGNSEISIFPYELAINNENDEKFKLL